MGILRKIALAIAPRIMLKRAKARSLAEAYYQSATRKSRLHYNHGESKSADGENEGATVILKDQARHLEQNYDLASGALDVLVNNTVGTGIMPDPRVRRLDGTLHTELNIVLREMFEEWAEHPEVTGELSYGESQRLLARTCYRDGESFLQYLTGKVAGLAHGSIVPLSLELIEPDLVPSDLNAIIDGGTVKQGVQKNSWGKPIRYFVYKDYPENSVTYISKDQVKSIPASQMAHIKLAKRIRQTRGVSVFSCVLERFDDIKEIEESERVAARVAASLTGVIQKGSPDSYKAPSASEGGVYRDMEMMPGMIFDDLRPGETVGTINSNRPNNGVNDFVDANLRRASSGIGAAYSSISHNYDGTYSSQRQELVESFANYKILWSQYLHHEPKRTYAMFVAMVLSARLVDLPKDVDMKTIYKAEYSRPVMPWVDPRKEMDAIEKEINLELIPRSDVIAGRGRNPAMVREKIEEEREFYPKVNVESQEPDTNA